MYRCGGDVITIAKTLTRRTAGRNKRCRMVREQLILYQKKYWAQDARTDCTIDCIDRIKTFHTDARTPYSITCGASSTSATIKCGRSGNRGTRGRARHQINPYAVQAQPERHRQRVRDGDPWSTTNSLPAGRSKRSSMANFIASFSRLLCASRAGVGSIVYVRVWWSGCCMCVCWPMQNSMRASQYCECVCEGPRAIAAQSYRGPHRYYPKRADNLTMRVICLDLNMYGLFRLCCWVGNATRRVTNA